jgi:protection of telomeres protein 1
MPLTLPEGFTNLWSTYNSPQDSYVSVIGVVVDLQAPTTTRTGQYMVTFKLLDEQLYASSWGSQGLTVRFFKNELNRLPQVQRKGDVVLLRNIKVSHWNQQPMALAHHSTEAVVFPGPSIPSPAFIIAFLDKKRLDCLGIPLDTKKVTLEEQQYVVHLKHAMSTALQSFPEPNPISAPSGAPTAPAAMRKRPGENVQAPNEPKKQKTSSFGYKFKTISDVRHYDFADICVQVIKKFADKYGNTELYVSDFTENKEMYYYAPPEAADEDGRDGDAYGYSGGTSRKQWPGPYGHLVLKVELRSPHADYANREVNEGELVLLRNVRLKLAGGGIGRLEGNMWTDNMNPDKVMISKIKNRDVPEIEAMLERQNRYWEARNANLKKADEKKGDKKKKKKAAKKTKQQETSENTHDAERTAGDTLEKTRGNINPHVRCSYNEVRISSIRSIIDPDNTRHTNTRPDGSEYILPFVNAKFRACVRVVDFEPQQLEDFAVFRTAEEDSGDDTSMPDYDSSLGYEWRFSLLLEDSTQSNGDNDRFWVSVGHEEAQFLFGNGLPDPTDLRRDRKLLSKLREKMCILWGNLEEKQESEAISNKPFECCLMEYGVEMDREDPEWKSTPFKFARQYRMFGVTIS